MQNGEAFQPISTTRSTWLSRNSESYRMEFAPLTLRMDGDWFVGIPSVHRTTLMPNNVIHWPTRHSFATTFRDVNTT